MTATPPLSGDAPLPSAGAERAKDKDVAAEKGYWNSFYSKFNIAHPSQFCVMTAIEAAPERPIVEFGCGNGRDSIYLATHGFTVYACDLSQPAIDKNVEKSKDVPTVEFGVVDASAAEEVRAVVARARAASVVGDAGNVNVYTRFFLHAIDQAQQDKFFAALSSSLVAGDLLYFEYRCSLDEKLDKFHGKNHYRRYIDTSALVEDLTKLGFDCFYEVTGRGMAKYKEEDPYISRVIARKV